MSVFVKNLEADRPKRLLIQGIKKPGLSGIRRSLRD
jgi:hypothetical protein